MSSIQSHIVFILILTEFGSLRGNQQARQVTFLAVYLSQAWGNQSSMREIEDIILSSVEKDLEMSSQLMVNPGLIEVSVSGTFKTEHILNSSGDNLGSVVIKGGKGEGVFTGGENLVLMFKKPSAWKNLYELQDGEAAVGKAQPPKKLSQAFDIELEDQVYHLTPGGKKGRSWTLRDGQGSEICEILPRGGLKRGAKIQVEAQISLKLLVFVYCLVVRRWQEESFSGDALDD